MSMFSTFNIQPAASKCQCFRCEQPIEKQEGSGTVLCDSCKDSAEYPESHYYINMYYFDRAD